MSITSVTGKNATLVQSLVDMRAQLDDLQRQLGTGKKSDTYAGLGLDRGLTVGLRSQLSAFSSYDNTITNVGVRLSVAQTSLTGIASAASTVKNAAVNSTFTIDQTGQTTDQATAFSQLDQILGILNTQVGNRYIFSGQSPDQPSVETTDHILNGNGTRAGLKTVIADRQVADGVSGLGRLLIPPPTATAATLTGSGATLLPDAPAVATGSQNLATLSSAGGTLMINGTSITVNPGDNAAAIVAAIHGQAGTTGVDAALNGSNQIVLTSANATTAVDLTGSAASLLGELGINQLVTNPTNLITQGAVTAGQTLTVQVGSNPQLTVVFGAGVGQVATLSALNGASGLAGLVGGTASANPTNGNITITAGNSTDTIAIGGTATAANFGITVASAPPDSKVTISEDVAGSIFGFKLASVTSSLAGATASGPSGSPPAIALNLGSPNPNSGDTIKFTFNLPDGTTQDLTLTATSALPPGQDQFTIGATPAATASNLRAALTTSVGRLAGTALSAATAAAAANNFFGGPPPMRVSGPLATATGLVAGTATDTVFWYTGEAGSTPARSTAIARVDTSITVNYGMRANEQALRTAVQNIALFAATTYSATNANAKGAYTALTQRVATNLGGAQGQQKISDIEADLAGAQTTLQSAKDRHTQTTNTLTDLLQSIEGISQEQVGAQLLALQTNLQASLQTTALLFKTSLVNYLAPA
jgi:flagellar hook-associated protein 3 FlgL